MITCIRWQRKQDLTGRRFFETVYQALLGLKSGPRAGHFLASLDKDFVVKRFKEASL